MGFPVLNLGRCGRTCIHPPRYQRQHNVRTQGRHRRSLITWRRKEECSKHLERRQKNHKSNEPASMGCPSIHQGCGAEQHSHLQRKRRTAIIPQSESHLAHTVVKRKVRAMHDQVENPMRKDSRSQNQARYAYPEGLVLTGKPHRPTLTSKSLPADYACKACNRDRARWKR